MPEVVGPEKTSELFTAIDCQKNVHEHSPVAESNEGAWSKTQDALLGGLDTRAVQCKGYLMGHG